MRILIFILLLIPFLSNSQTKKKYIEIGDNYFETQDYFGASLEYEKAVEMDSLDIHLLFKYAESLRLYNNHVKAEYYYAKIFSKDRGRIYPIGVFHLAEQQKHNKKYRDAIKTWKKASSLFKKDKKGYEYLRARHEGLSTSWAMRAIRDTTEDVAVTNLGDGVNTTNWEFAPVVKDDKLYFSSLRSENSGPQLQMLDNEYVVKIYKAEKSGEYWATDKTISPKINQANMNNASGSFSSDGKYFYFVRANEDFVSQIMVSEFSNGKWSQPKKVEGGINQANYSSTQPNYFEIEGKSYLIYASNKPGGKGKMDLWHSQLTSFGNSGSHVNLGKDINSPDNEVTPFYDTENKTLFFSSKWHKNFGGFDVFQSKGDLNKLGEPENMGQPINTSWNDFYFYPTDNNEAFLTSNRLGSMFLKGPTCCNDIWQVKLPKKAEEKSNEIVIETLDDLNKYLPVTLFFHNDCPNPRTVDTTTNLNYITTYNDYKELVPKYKTEYSANLNDEKSIEAKLDIEDFFKNKVDKGVDDLNLFTALLLKELDKGANIQLTVKGFASPLAKTDYNVKLTGRRISSLVNYLKEHGEGEFNKYIDGISENGGSLSFVRIPFGEYTASTLISDNLNDQKNSVYSRAAGLERKIEVQSVTQAKRDSLYSEISCSQELFDFGQLKQGDIVTHEFVIKNTGNKDLIISEVHAKCGCNVIDFPKNPIKPNEEAKIKVTLNTTKLEGKQVKSVTVIANSFPRTKRLVTTSEIHNNE